MRSTEEVDGIPLYTRRPDLSHAQTEVISLGDSEYHDVRWDVRKDTHLLATGDLCSGKSMLLRGVIQHCLEHADDWAVLSAELTNRYLLSREYDDSSVIRAHGPVESLKMLRGVKKVIEDRRSILAPEGGQQTPLRKVMVTISELEFISPLYLKDSMEIWHLGPYETRQELLRKVDEVSEEALELVAFILDAGRVAGVHLAATTPSIRNGSTFPHDYQATLTPEIISKFSSRLAFDKMDREERQEFIGGRLPLPYPLNHAGRGVVRIADGVFPLQVYSTGLWL